MKHFLNFHIGIASFQPELGKVSPSCDLMDQTGHDLAERFASRLASGLAQQSIGDWSRRPMNDVARELEMLVQAKLRLGTH